MNDQPTQMRREIEEIPAAVARLLDQGADTIRRLAAAGVDSVVLVPLPTGDFAGQLATFAERLLPEVRAQS